VVGALDSVVLRADLAVDGRTVIGHTTELSATHVIVQVDEDASVGAQVEVTLSLSGFIDEPYVLVGQIVARQIARGPGTPGLWEISWVHRTVDQAERVAELIDRIEQSGDVASLQVLLVEDSAMTRQVFELGVMRLLSGRVGALKLDWADDAEGAWKKLQERSYDVAIVDCLLPGIQGPELIRKLRDRGLSDVAVVAMSVGGEEMRRSALDAGADLFVHKPVVVATLLASLERLGRARGSAS
jgi:CheY-like chemotaxis protein